MDNEPSDRHPVWVEVDLAAVRHNVQAVRELVSDGVQIMAVVKADAYGHGAVETSKAILSAGADALAVTRLEEAAALRRAGITDPVLIFDSTLPEFASEVVALDLQQTLCTTQLAESLSRAAQEQGKTALVHIKVDTGMGRLGLPRESVAEFIKYVSNLPGIQVAGTYTHFATALERDLKASEEQLRLFQQVLGDLKSAGLPVGLAHAANSAAMIRLPESRLDIVRPGTLLYGQYPSRFVPHVMDLRETWKLKARISFLKRLPPGHAVGYGADYRTSRESNIAILPIGYADGLTMVPESLVRRQTRITHRLAGLIQSRGGLSVTVRGQKAPVVGRVAMQMCAIDVTDIRSVEIGDEVLIPARRLAVSARISRLYSGR